MWMQLCSYERMASKRAENPPVFCDTSSGSGGPPSGQPEAQRRERRPHPSHQQTLEMKLQWITCTKSNSKYYVLVKPKSERVNGEGSRAQHIQQQPELCFDSMLHFGHCFGTSTVKEVKLPLLWTDGTIPVTIYFYIH